VEDREAAVEAERHEPTDPRVLGLAPDRGGWSNFTIEAYLEAALRWAEDTDMDHTQGLPAEPSWKAFAVFLYCGKIYEQRPSENRRNCGPAMGRRPMADVPDWSNFFSSLHTALSREQVTGLYGAAGWRVRKCSWVDYEVVGEWAELVVEAESPILMHGPVADVVARAEEIVAPLRAAGVQFTAECYGPEPGRELLLTLRS